MHAHSLAPVLDISRGLPPDLGPRRFAPRLYMFSGRLPKNQEYGLARVQLGSAWSSLNGLARRGRSGVGRSGLPRDLYFVSPDSDGNADSVTTGPLPPGAEYPVRCSRPLARFPALADSPDLSVLAECWNADGTPNKFVRSSRTLPISSCFEPLRCRPGWPRRSISLSSIHVDGRYRRALTWGFYRTIVTTRPS